MKQRDRTVGRDSGSGGSHGSRGDGSRNGRGGGGGGRGGERGQKKGNSGTKGNMKMDKKLMKKQAEKLSQEGLRFLERAEDEENHERKLSFYSEAEEKFQQALVIHPTHADSLYHLAMTSLDRHNYMQESNMETSKDEILKIENILFQIIQNDTSRRGEISGYSHRILANIYLQHSAVFLPFHENNYENLLRKSRIHIERAQEILSNNPELDVYYFEYCEALNSYWEVWSHQTVDQSVTIIEYLFIFFKQLIESSLSLSCSSGIDRDIYLLYATFLNSFTDFVLTKRENSSPLQNYLSSEPFLHFLKDPVCVSLIQVLKTLCFLGNYQFLWTQNQQETVVLPDKSNDYLENIQCISLAGNLIRSSVEVCEWISIEYQSISEEDSLQKSLHLLHLRLYVCLTLRINSSPEVLFGNIYSLAEDLMFIASLIDRNKEKWDYVEYSSKMSHIIAQLISHETDDAVALNINKLSNIGETFQDAIVSIRECSKMTFLTSLAIYESLASSSNSTLSNYEDQIDMSDYSTLLYNLMCLCWKLNQPEECEGYLKRYIHSISTERNCPPQEILSEVIVEIGHDPDVEGLCNSQIGRNIYDFF